MAEPFGLRGWLRRHMPSRETIDSYRLLRPFAKQLRRPESVAHEPPFGAARGRARARRRRHHSGDARRHRGVILAIPVRANVAIAGACTLVVNPLTIPPMYYRRLPDRQSGSCTTRRSPIRRPRSRRRANWRGCCSGCTRRRARSRSACSPSPLSAAVGRLCASARSGAGGCAGSCSGGAAIAAPGD